MFIKICFYIVRQYVTFLMNNIVFLTTSQCGPYLSAVCCNIYIPKFAFLEWAMDQVLIFVFSYIVFSIFELGSLEISFFLCF